jgi:hypothetical protein
MISIILSNNCSNQLDILKNVSWITVGDPHTSCDVLITETPTNTTKETLQIIFTNDIVSIQKEPNWYISLYKNGLQEYLDYICECVRNKIAVHVFGDSHSIVTHKVTICRENWLGFNTTCPLTMFRFGKEGLDLHECIRIMGNGHEQYPIREGDIAMYCYGEIDVRYLILKHCNREEISSSWSGNHYNECRELNDIIENLINNYIVRIKNNEQRYKCTSYVYFIVPPPTYITPGDNMYTGTLEERKLLYEYFTKYLYSACDMNSIPVISIYENIVDSDGFIKPEYQSKHGDFHIHTDYYYLIRDAIMRQLCGITNESHKEVQIC